MTKQIECALESMRELLAAIEGADGSAGGLQSRKGALLRDDSFGMGAAGGGARATFVRTFGIKVKIKIKVKARDRSVRLHGRRCAPRTGESSVPTLAFSRRAIFPAFRDPISRGGEGVI